MTLPISLLFAPLIWIFWLTTFRGLIPKRPGEDREARTFALAFLATAATLATYGLLLAMGVIR